MEQSEFIPFARPSVSQADVDAVAEAIRSGWWTTGPRVRQFEEAIATYTGIPNAIAVNSCTAGLHVALSALGVCEQDFVACPTFTFAATAEVAAYVGAIPLLVDVDASTLNMDSRMLRALIEAMGTDEPEAAVRQGVRDGIIAPGCLRAWHGSPDRRLSSVIPVHLAGLACDMDAIDGAARLCEAHVVGDAAHALETTYHRRPVAAYGDVSVFSFYATKNLPTGEGGMIVTADSELGDRMRQLTLHGISRDAWGRYTREGSWYYEIEEIGFKYNMPDLLAALGLSQLSRLEEMGERRAKIASRYVERLDTDEALVMPATSTRDRHAWHLFILRLVPERLRIDRDTFIEDLRAVGIGTSVHFIPLHLHPFYMRRYGYEAGDFPVAEDAFSRCISLPLYPAMTDDEVERVCDSVLRLCEKHRL